MQAMGFQLWAPPSVGTDSTTNANINSNNNNNNNNGSGVNGAAGAIVSILVSKNAGRYRVQADSYPALYVVLAGIKYFEQYMKCYF